MALLSQYEIVELLHAVMSSGLADSRNSLLEGIDPHFVAAIRDTQKRADQLLTDLNALSKAQTLRDGTVPLEIWLHNASALTHGRREEDVFNGALKRIELARTMRSEGPPPEGAPLPSNARPEAAGGTNVRKTFAALGALGVLIAAPAALVAWVLLVNEPLLTLNALSALEDANLSALHQTLSSTPSTTPGPSAPTLPKGASTDSLPGSSTPAAQGTTNPPSKQGSKSTSAQIKSCGGKIISRCVSFGGI